MISSDQSLVLGASSETRGSAGYINGISCEQIPYLCILSYPTQNLYHNHFKSFYLNETLLGLSFSVHHFGAITGDASMFIC